MPCRYDPEENLYYERKENSEKYGLKIDNEDLLVTIACTLSKRLEELDEIKNMPKYVQDWFKKHKIEDERRNKNV